MINKKIIETIENVENASDEEMEVILFSVLKWFKAKSLGNPFNYNRAFEWLQAKFLGFKLTTVGGGSDGIDENDVTAEFKAAAYKGLGKKGQELSYSFSYNGTSRLDTWDEQEKYCLAKINRDPFHYWSIIDYTEGKFVKTYKIPAAIVTDMLMPKWKNSFENPQKKDPRIGGAISTIELAKLVKRSHNLPGEVFEVILH
jgi:hypothetical protein